jgi:hypothetical protein
VKEQGEDKREREREREREKSEVIVGRTSKNEVP